MVMDAWLLWCTHVHPTRRRLSLKGVQGGVGPARHTETFPQGPRARSDFLCFVRGSLHVGKLGLPRRRTPEHLHTHHVWRAQTCILDCVVDQSDLVLPVHRQLRVWT